MNTRQGFWADLWAFLLDEALRERIRRQVRENASPHHVPKVIVQVADIPRTISGKITEMAVRDVVHGRPVKNKEALANPEAVKSLDADVKKTVAAGARLLTGGHPLDRPGSFYAPKLFGPAARTVVRCLARLPVW